MISPGYVSMMARYNAWQNRQLTEIIPGMDDAALYHDHKAFFGSIMHTLNHIMWGDALWMSRFSGEFEPPAVPAAQHFAYTASPAAWVTARTAFDGRIKSWASMLSEDDLARDLDWTAKATGQDKRQPIGMLIAGFFNHQTHHRGQVHAMLTASGQSAPTTDVCFMPEDA